MAKIKPHKKKWDHIQARKKEEVTWGSTHQETHSCHIGMLPFVSQQCFKNLA
jgi:hypothetical protein